MKDRPMFVTNDYPPIVSGIGTVFYNTLRHIPQRDFIILCPWVDGCVDFDKRNDLRVLRMKIPLSESRFAKILKTVANIGYVLFYSRTLNVGMVHCGQILANGVAGVLVKKIFNIPYVVWVYGSETIRFGNSDILAFLMKMVLSNAEKVVVNSTFTELEFRKFGVEVQKIVKITPGVDTTLFSPQDKKLRLLDKFRLHDKIVLLTVARLDERKGHDLVISALRELRPQYPNLVYLIVGKGREENRLRKIVEHFGMMESVIFAGYVGDNELPDYYNLADIFVLPNRETEQTALKGDYEGFGIVFVEASACAKPVIGGLSGGVGDAVVDGVTGLLVDSRSVDELTRAIKMLVDNPVKSAEMGHQGRMRATGEFDWTVIANKFIEAFPES